MNDTPKTRLLIIAPELCIGGGETLLKDIFLQVDRTKFDVRLCVFNYGYESIYGELSQAESEMTILDKKRISRLSFFCKLVRLIKDFRPDVITTWAFSGTFNGRLAAWLAGCPRVVPQVHSNLGSGTLSSFKDYVVKVLGFMERFLFRFDAGMIVVSNSVKANTCKRYGLSEERVSVVYNGINTDSFVPAAPEMSLKHEFGIPDEAKVVSTVARLAAIKNHKMLLRAARSICSHRKDIYFLVVGPSGTCDYGDKDETGRPLDNMEVLKNLAREYDIQDNVIFTGARRDVHKILSITDICAMTSWNEGLNNAVLEAMSCGKPTVATSVGGMCETFEEGKSGYFVDSDDDEAMAEKIEILADDSCMRQKFGEAARERALELFSIPAMIGQDEIIYQRAATGEWSLLNLLRTGYAFKSR